MSETQEYVTVDTVGTEAEEVETVASQDFSSHDLTTPGKYLNETRTLTYMGESTATLDEATAKAARLKGLTAKVHMWQVDLKGLTDPTTGRRLYRPDRTWISTRPRRERVFGSRNEFYPGVTSDVHKYLTACQYKAADLRNLKGIDAIKSILEDSLSRTVGVQTGLGPRGKKTGAKKANGKDEYRQPKGIYTKHCLTPEGTPAREITDSSGETWQVGETVERFIKPSA